MTNPNDDAPVSLGQGVTINTDFPLNSVNLAPTETASPVPFPSGLDHDTVAYQLDALRKSHDDLHAKLNHAIEGIGAVYQIVDHLARMLSAVQQVASMMPGGKKIAQAMQNGVKTNG